MKTYYVYFQGNSSYKEPIIANTMKQAKAIFAQMNDLDFANRGVQTMIKASK